MTDEDLAEKIAGYAKVKLCRSVEGFNSPDDWLLSEKERYAICKALRDHQRVWRRFSDAVTFIGMLVDDDISTRGPTAAETLATFRDILASHALSSAMHTGK